jgi:hypothetical protein
MPEVFTTTYLDDRTSLKVSFGIFMLWVFPKFCSTANRLVGMEKVDAAAVLRY